MKQYVDLVNQIVKEGVWKEPARPGQSSTLSLFGTRMEFNIQDGFPLMTQKKMFYKGIFTELLWFLKGETNIYSLVSNGVNIWNDDAYRWYKKFAEENGGEEQNEILHKNEDGTYRVLTQNEFIGRIKVGRVSMYGEYTLGDLGKVYGHQWRNQNGVDQLHNLLDQLVNNRNGRYQILDAWNLADNKDMALPPCHLLYQFNCRKLTGAERLIHGESLRGLDGSDYSEFSDLDTHGIADQFYLPTYAVDLQMYQRSVDTALGLPFNVASCGLFLHIIAHMVGYAPGKLVWVGGDTHIYEHHLETLKEQVLKPVHYLPSLSLGLPVFGSIPEILDYIETVTYDDFLSEIRINNYTHNESVKYKLDTGN